MKLADLEPRFRAIGKALKDPHDVLSEIVITVEGRVKPHVPVFTGNLRRSIHHRVTGRKAYVGTNVSYGPFVHEGTKHMAGRPFLVEGLDDSQSRIIQILEKYGTALFKKVK